MRAVIYARVSSAGQKDRHTIESQLRALPEYVQRQGWKLVGTYKDDGKTAKAGHLEARDGLARLFADAKAGKFDVVVCVDLDRLTRSEDMSERGQVLGAFQQAGVRIATPNQTYDLGSSMGDLMALLSTWTAATENRKRRENIMRGKERALSEGGKPAGPTPYGYEYRREGRHWYEDAVKGPIVREILKRVATGESTAAIAEDLNARSVPPPSKKWNLKDARWHRERVWQVARREAYVTGLWTADKAKGARVKVPTLVDEDTWHRAQTMLQRHGRRGEARSKHVYLAGGAVCAACGAMIRISSAGLSRGIRRPAYYVCAHRRRPRHDGVKCMLPTQRTEDVDARIWEAVTNLIRQPDLLERVLGQRVARADASNWAGDLAIYERKLAHVLRVEQTMSEEFSAGHLSESAWKAQLASLAGKRKLLERQVETARKAVQEGQHDQSVVDGLRAQVGELCRRLPKASPEVRRDVVRALCPGGEHAINFQADGTVTLGVVLTAQAGHPLVARDFCSSGERGVDAFSVGVRLIA